MKRYVYTTSTYLMALLFTGIWLFCSCSDEEAAGPGQKTDGAPSLSILAGVSTGIVTRATDDPASDIRNQNGSWIKNLTIFLFASDAVDGDTPLLTKTIQVSGNPAQLNQANKTQLTGQELSGAGIGIGTHVAIYAIANYIPANAENLTKKQVIDQTTTVPDYKRDNAWGKNFVPMSGKIPDYEIKSESNQEISLPMQRAVIRVTINITDEEFNNDKYLNGKYSWEIASVKLYNDYSTTYLWNEGIPSAPRYRAESAGIGTTPSAYPSTASYSVGPFYLNCNESSTTHTASDPIKIKISGSRSNENNIVTPFEYTVDLKKADGTYLFERNTKITATLTLKAGSVDIKTEALPWDGEIQTNDGEILMRQEPKANCYIVKPESAILIPVSQVQAVNAFNSNYATAIGTDETLTAELTWTDVKGASSGKGLADDASIAKVEVLGTGPDALLLVVTGTQVGNSVVSVLQSGNFRWSWHIWVTDYDPETTNCVSGSYVFMDRNLGAKTNEPDPNGHNSTGVIGTYYQWGRPIPLPSKDPSSTNTTLSSPSTVYDADGNPVSRTSTTDINLIGNPGYFFNTNYSGFLQLWNTNGNKTPLDPCPAGWRVPIRDAWNSVTFNTFQPSGVQTNAGFYPTSQAYTYASTINGWFKPFFWTANTSDQENQPGAYTCADANATTGNFGHLNDCYAVPVRCVKE